MIAFKNGVCFSRFLNSHPLQASQWMNYTNRLQISTICTAVSSFEKYTLCYPVANSKSSKTNHAVVHYYFGMPPQNQQQQQQQQKRSLVWHAGCENLKEANRIQQEINKLLNNKANITLRKDNTETDLDPTTTQQIQVLNEQLQTLYEQYKFVTGEEYDVD